MCSFGGLSCVAKTLTLDITGKLGDDYEEVLQVWRIQII